MEIKVLIDEKRKTTSIEYDESKTDKGTVGALLISALFNYTKELQQSNVIFYGYCAVKLW